MTTPIQVEAKAAISTPRLSTYRKNVKVRLVEVLLASGFTRNSETSFQKIAAGFCTYTVTLHDTNYTLLHRERSLRDGWYESSRTYTYMSVNRLPQCW